MGTGLVVIIAVLGLALGFGLGFLIRRYSAQGKLQEAQAEAQRLREETIMSKRETLERMKALELPAVIRGASADLTEKMVAAVGAVSELCPPQPAKEGKFDEISKRAAEFCRAVQAARTGVKA